MSNTWIFDPRYGYCEVRFGGTAKVLQSYFAVAKIVIWLCTYLNVLLMSHGKHTSILGNTFLFLILLLLGEVILPMDLLKTYDPTLAASEIYRFSIFSYKPVLKSRPELQVLSFKNIFV